MIDLRHLREHPQDYQESVKRRGMKVDIDRLLELDEQLRKLQTERDTLRSELKVEGKPTPEQLKKLQKTKEELQKLDTCYLQLDTEFSDLLRQVPNLLADGTPDGGEEANHPIRHWGEAKKTAGADHGTLAERNGWLDFARGAKVAGAKFYYLKGPAVRLEMSVMRLAMDILEEHGFTLMAVPHLVNEKVADGTGFLPRGEERQIYKVEDEDLHLIGTAEMPLTGYHADEILDESQLPLAYAALSPSYRREAGAYGKYSKGLYRVHQFDKLEMYVFCLPKDSEAWHEKLVEIEEDICRLLEIPYRVVRIAAGDLGAPAYKKYDLEYWSPVEGEYRELTSCSNVTDYQARRLAVRTRTGEGTRPVHTLNGTAVAFSRTFIALLENHQQPDGKVKLPLALHKYYGDTHL